MQERLQKIISRCGLASRRKAEELIQQGLVKVNGKTAELGMKADLGTDHIKVKGKLIRPPGKKVYLILNKPRKCLTAMNDSEGRTVVKDLIGRVKIRVYPVGRLDYNSEGLLLMTNDGDLTHAVLHPGNKIPKTYRVKVEGHPDEEDIKKLKQGVMLEDGMTAPAKVGSIKNLKVNSWIEITIHEGRKRQIRRMLERVGHPVIRLLRTNINGLSLGGLKPGDFRYLASDEIKRLKEEAGL